MNVYLCKVKLIDQLEIKKVTTSNKIIIYEFLAFPIYPTLYLSPVDNIYKLIVENL